MDEGLVIGIDGGGSGSRAVLARRDGKILGIHKGPPCNYQNSNPIEAKNALHQLMSDVVAECNVEELHVECAVFGLAGLDTPADALILRDIAVSALKETGVQTKEVKVENDGVVTLFGLFGEGPGVLILSGTGSIAWGTVPGRTPVRAGGWGHRLGDEGSGYGIGRAALARMFHDRDRLRPDKELEAAILSTLQCASIDDVAQWAYSDVYSITRVAGLARGVIGLAERGNKAASEIINRAAEQLANLFSSVMVQLQSQEEINVALCGGILENYATVRSLLATEILNRFPKSKFIDGEFPSALGATAYALRLAGADMTDAMEHLNRAYKLYMNPAVNHLK